MNLPDTVPCAASVAVGALTELAHRCPYVDEADHGTISIQWRTRGRTIELHALRRWLDSFADVRISHEEITAQIADALSQLGGIALIAVETRWSTAAFHVTVKGA